MNRQVRDRGTGMRLTERTRELIPSKCYRPTECRIAIYIG